MVTIDNIFRIVLNTFRGRRFIVGLFLLGFWIGRSIESTKCISLTWFSGILLRSSHVLLSLHTSECFISSICISSLPAALLSIAFFNTFLISLIVILLSKGFGLPMNLYMLIFDASSNCFWKYCFTMLHCFSGFTIIFSIFYHVLC